MSVGEQVVVVQGDAGDERVRQARVRSVTLARSGVSITFVLTAVLFSVLKPAAFVDVANFRTIVSNAAIVAIPAAGLAVSLILHEFDLSVSAIIAWAGALVAEAISAWGLTWPLAVLVTLLSTLVFGAITGGIVARFPGSSLVLTLGTLSLIRGLEFGGPGGSTIFEGIPDSFANLARGKILGINNPIWIMIIIVVAIWYLLSFTQFGTEVRAAGGDRHAAEAAGIRVGRLVVVAFLISSVTAGVAGILRTAQAKSYLPSEGGQGLLLPIFTAAFLGAALSGGRKVTVLYTLVAAVYLSMVYTGLGMIAATRWVSALVEGIVLLAAVLIAKITAERTRIAGVT